MKIKRYMAVSMRAALAQVRAEQGPDAVILSSRRVDEGIEVIAAVDYDEALFVDATRPRAPAAPPRTPTPSMLAPTPSMPAPTLELRAAEAAFVKIPAAQPHPAPSAPARGSEPRSVSSSPSVAPLTSTSPAIYTAVGAPVRTAVSTAVGTSVRTALRTRARTPTQDMPDHGFSDMQRELHDLRELVQGEMAQLSWHDKRLREPLQTRVLEELTAMDIAPDVALSLASQTPPSTSLKNPTHIPLALLLRHLPVVKKLSTVNGGVIALVGPTGAGKTTTIAKLAAHWSMQHGSQDLALVSTDGYRIGAREQLMTYARMLGAPMHVANSGPELARVLERLKSKKLVLIDTAGMGPRDVRMSEQLAALKLGAARARVLLTLPAQCEGHALDAIVRSFAKVSPTACVITKVDESASLGAIISTTLRHKLRIAYLCDGQRVPEDLHTGHERRVWLIRAARKLKEHAPPLGERYYARNFARASAHA